MAKRSRSGRRTTAPGGETAADDLTTTPDAPDAPDAFAIASADAGVLSAPHAAPVTRELPASPLPQALFPAEQTPPDASAAPPADVQPDEDFDAGATREAAIVTPTPARPPMVDADATIVRERFQPEFMAAPDAPPPPEPVTATEPTSAPDAAPDAAKPQAPDLTREAPPTRPRFNTLAGAFNRSRLTPPLADGDLPPVEDLDDTGGITDEVDADDEWAFADQPTVHLSQDELQALRPSFLETDERSVWPPRPAEASSIPPSRDATPPPAPQPASQPAPFDDPAARDWRAGLPPRPQPPFPLNATSRPASPGERLAAPDGRPVQPPAPGDAPPDYRMERFQELRRHRVAHEQGEEATDDITPVADAVRQWWHDLRPGVGSALQYQREARESGSHPLPAYAPPHPTSRLGDAFGKLAASAREVAGPALKAIHDHVEHAAQGFIQKFEGDQTRQQAPFLGPGRVAVFFRRGVTVGQAQRLLAASSARPMRLIPRKHGILAQVMPGHESEVGEKLRGHPYVDDVVYMDYVEYGARG